MFKQKASEIFCPSYTVFHVKTFGQFFFIDFPGYDLHRWPVFNVADAAVSCGMILIIWMILFQKVKVKEELAT